ncbi:MAG: Fur family transcriptional regulator [Nitriliruptorales bacterium]
MNPAPSDHGALHESVGERLRRVRQRYTPQRRHLIEVLAEAGRPLATADILDLGDDLAQSSAYRNLQVLEQAGAVRRLVTSADSPACYELAEDLTSHHHHLVCGSCGTIEDVELSPPLEQVLDAFSEELTAEGGFAADHHRLDIVGTCATCRS